MIPRETGQKSSIGQAPLKKPYVANAPSHPVTTGSSNQAGSTNTFGNITINGSGQGGGTGILGFGGGSGPSSISIQQQATTNFNQSSQYQNTTTTTNNTQNTSTVNTFLQYLTGNQSSIGASTSASNPFNPSVSVSPDQTSSQSASQTPGGLTSTLSDSNVMTLIIVAVVVMMIAFFMRQKGGKK
jgi:hypothetical protein